METADLQPQNPWAPAFLNVDSLRLLFFRHSYLEACFRKARVISKSVKKDTKKTQASILTKGKIVYSGNLHNPFQSAIAVFYFVQGGCVCGLRSIETCVTVFF